LRIAVIALGMMVAGAVCGWDRTTPLGPGVEACAAAQAVRVIISDVDAVPAVAGTLPVANDVPGINGQVDEAEVSGGVGDFAPVACGGVLAFAVPGFAPVSGFAGVVTNRVRAYAVFGGVLKHEVDPLLSLFDIWNEGPLGELRRAANRLSLQGDTAAFDAAAAEYWRAMNAAEERRQAFGARGKRARAPVDP